MIKVSDAITKLILTGGGSEHEKDRKAVSRFHDRVFKTKTGLALLESIYKSYF